MLKINFQQIFLLLKFFLGLIFFLNFLSCEDPTYISLSAEELFKLKYGFLENQLNLTKNSTPTFCYNDIFFANGIFYIVNGNLQKIMAFSYFGELLLLLYNPDLNPPPILLPHTHQTQEPNYFSRKAVAINFNEVGPLAVDDRQNIFVVDSPYKELKLETSELQLRVVKQFSREGELLNIIGKEGKNTEPFSNIEKIFITETNELVVICFSAKGKTVYWFDKVFNLLYEVEFDLRFLPVLNTETTPLLQAIVPDYNKRQLYCFLVNYSLKKDQNTKLVAQINYNSSYIFTFDLGTQKYLDQILKIPEDNIESGVLLFAESKKNYIYPYTFLGVSSAGYFYFLKLKSFNLAEMLVLEPSGDLIKRFRLPLENSQLLASFFKISPEGMLYALLIENNQAKVFRWRTDKFYGG